MDYLAFLIAALTKRLRDLDKAPSYRRQSRLGRSEESIKAQESGLNSYPNSTRELTF